MGGNLGETPAEVEKKHVQYDQDVSSDYPMMAAENEVKYQNHNKDS